ncbi:hypothetical protein Tchl_0106 [Thauera chlorobenzoica]|uniref:Uncharacterized protein n=1 Tax=Thauera chlorobenzoica TaxID=96773 RepID=A0A1L6F7U2_9RHOO|nr:hypothetical protein Tchl_0106 [Thauera chlorobenzoica]
MHVSGSSPPCSLRRTGRRVPHSGRSVGARRKSIRAEAAPPGASAEAFSYASHFIPEKTVAAQSQ